MVGYLCVCKLAGVAVSGREGSMVQTFFETSVHINFTHSSYHMTRRSVIQGCPTLSDS